MTLWNLEAPRKEPLCNLENSSFTANELVVYDFKNSFISATKSSITFDKSSFHDSVNNGVSGSALNCITCY
jgi:hypothetical protein